MGKNLIIAVSLALLSGASYARVDERLSTYNMGEIYELAQNYRSLVEKRNRPTNTGAVKKADAFKTYVAAMLDSENDSARYKDCGKRARLGDIAYRAAVMITSFPLDPSQSAADSVSIALVIGCSRSS
jgi:hypothetical protein